MTTNAAFGTVFVKYMSVARWRDGVWDAPKLGPVEPLSLHPAAHVFHYGSACFEGLKAHRGVDGIVRVFRLDAHVPRLQNSADVLCLPEVPSDLVTGMITDVVAASLEEVPDPPGSLYIRPTLIGTEPNVGAAGHPSNEATLFVLASPVGDYFSGGVRPLTLAVETQQLRTTPHFGMVKAGANYVMALGPTMRARDEMGVDQILFAPGGQVQETGASNFLLIDSERVVTPELSESFLHGVTRDCVLTIAAELGYEVDERELTMDEVLAFAARPDAEAALSGTAALLSGVGHLLHEGSRLAVGNGEVGPNTTALRQALAEVQTVQRPAPSDWFTAITV